MNETLKCTHSLW